MTLRPLKTSTIVAVGYILFCSLYIWFSGIVAVKMSHSIPSLYNIELYKGLAFVVITGIISFFFTHQLLVRIQVQNRELETQRRALLEAQARVLTGTFAAGIGHDINNVLSVIDFGISELQDAVPECKRNDIERISKAYTMIRDLATRLQRIGKARTEVDMKDIKIVEFVRQTVDFAKRHRKIKPCEIYFTDQESGLLNINPFLLEQTIFNLMLNAADATESKGKIEVRVVNLPHQVSIEVHDNGKGINERDRETLFQPYYTTKPDGTGLGLAMVKMCAELHGGTVQIDKSHLGGALFRIALPVNTGTVKNSTPEMTQA
jgi:signal transduction histidine kinase